MNREVNKKCLRNSLKNLFCSVVLMETFKDSSDKKLHKLALSMKFLH